MRFARKVLAGSLGLVAILACASPDARDESSGDSATSRSAELRSLPPDSLLLARFQAFLDSSIVTQLDTGDTFVGRPERCEADGIVPQVNYLLATGSALTVLRRTDESATVQAELTFVGEDSISDAGGRQVRLGVDADTVEWDMVRDSTGTWYPCGYASSMRDVGPMGTRGLPAVWIPERAGWGTVKQLADSVRRSRGLNR